MILIFLLLLSAESSWCWSWTDNTVGYKILAAKYSEQWTEVAQIDQHGSPEVKPCVSYTHPTPPPGVVVFFVVVSYNSAGESPTEHGSFAGEGYFPGPVP